VTASWPEPIRRRLPAAGASRFRRSSRF
jgi:hypothetical protein